MLRSHPARGHSSRAHPLSPSRPAVCGVTVTRPLHDRSPGLSPLSRRVWCDRSTCGSCSMPQFALVTLVVTGSCSSNTYTASFTLGGTSNRRPKSNTRTAVTALEMPALAVPTGLSLCLPCLPSLLLCPTRLPAHTYLPPSIVVYPSIPTHLYRLPTRVCPTQTHHPSPRRALQARPSRRAPTSTSAPKSISASIGIASVPAPAPHAPTCRCGQLVWATRGTAVIAVTAVGNSYGPYVSTILLVVRQRTSHGM